MPKKKPMPKPIRAPLTQDRDWKVFFGDGRAPSREALRRLPEPPPWRISSNSQRLDFPRDRPSEFFKSEELRAAPFLPGPPMILAVNTALYLRRPLLLTGKPGTGKSTLISKVAHELMLGKVLRWPITSRSNVKAGIYNYDAVGRLQSRDKNAPVTDFLTLGPMGTALAATTWPRALLIDEIDKSDLDFANDLLNIIEEGVYEIPELARMGERKHVTVKDAEGRKVPITGGKLICGQFPFVVMTSNAEREFPPPFLRRCVRLKIDPPNPDELRNIVDRHLSVYFRTEAQQKQITDLVTAFVTAQNENQEVATDQLLNAVFLTVGLSDPDRRTFSQKDLDDLRANLMHPLTA
jgi:MoxR-like ATPase